MTSDAIDANADEDIYRVAFEASPAVYAEGHQATQTDCYHPEDWRELSLEKENAAFRKGCDECLSTHLADYQKSFGRVQVGTERVTLHR